MCSLFLRGLFLAIAFSVAQGAELEDLGLAPQTDVTAELMLAYDIEAMRAAKQDFDLKMKIYTSASDMNTGGLTLQGLSTNAETQFGRYPLFNLYKAGFEMLGASVESDLPGQFDGRPVSVYADTVVNDLFLLNASNIEAEAALTFNVAMAYYGKLYDMLTSCLSNDKDAMIVGLDKASALWVGGGQVRGDPNTGFMFYAVAEYVSGTKFNQIDTTDGSQTLVNTEVISRFLSLRRIIDDDLCSSINGYIEMRDVVRELVFYLNLVLVQMMLHKIMIITDQEPTDFVELYSLALLPQIAVCDDDLHEKLVELTIENDVEDSTRWELISTLQASYDCLGLTCEQVGSYMTNSIPQCDLSNSTKLAGYTAASDVRPIARIDRDIRQIRWMMRFNATEAAREYYTYGWNSIFSLRQLARAETTVSASDTYTAAAQYFANDAADVDFADVMVGNVLNRTGEFGEATNEQLQTSLDGVLRGLVMFLGITNELQLAVNLIAGSPDNKDDAQTAWDNGAALYIGSTEGELVGGDQESPGESIYGLARDVCMDFSLCDSPDDAAPINDDLTFNLVAGANLFKGSDVSSLGDLYDLMLDQLIVPVIQGLLRSVVESGQDPTSADVGYVYGYSRSVLAFFSTNNPPQLGTLAELLDTEPSPDITDQIFGTLEVIINASEVNCEDINSICETDDLCRDVCQGRTIPGVLPPSSLSPSPISGSQPAPAPSVVTRPPAVEKPEPPSDQPLAWDGFVFTNQNVADNDAAVALDVRNMWAAENVANASSIYSTGQNFLSGLHGLPNITSLSKMSTLSLDIMAKDAIYNFYRYALYDDEEFDDPSADVSAFADQVVTLALNPDNGDSPLLAAEATVVVHSFFMILRQLNEAARECETEDQESALAFLDSAVALWIGKGQAPGEYNSGYMMYSMAQLAREHFGMDEAEAKSNTDLMFNFNTVKTILQNCAVDPRDSFTQMRFEIKEIARLLSVPMVQELLYYIAVGDKNFEELFAVAFLPQVAACSAGDYVSLEEILFKNQYSTLSPDDQTKDLEELAAGLRCLGLTCADLGDASKSQYDALKDLVARVCQSLDSLYETNLLAGFKTEDPVSALPESFLDLDIHQIDMLMRTGAIETAQEFYELGYNSYDSGLLTLQTLAAASTNETAGPLAKQYNAYFKEPNFPDSYIKQIFNDQVLAGASRSQKASAVRRVLQASLVYLAVNSMIESAQNACVQGQQGEKFIDKAAALFTGSIEGTSGGGSQSNSGVMLMALGKEVCDAFDSCESSGDATANELVLFAFTDMKEFLKTKDCDSALAIKKETLQPMLSVPIIQAVLMFGQEVVDLPADSDDDDLTSLDVTSRAILPQVAPLNKTSENMIVVNTEYTPGEQSVVGGVEQLVDAFKYVIRGLGVSCDAIGTLVDAGLSTCGGDVAPNPDTSTKLGKNTTIYTSTTYVQNFADIALDIKQMEDDLKLNRKDLALMLYKKGQNSPVYDKFGTKVDDISLAGLSTNASETMRRNPLFQTTVYGLKDESGNYLGKPATEYADSVVQEFFNKAESSTLPAEAAVVLNIWMEVANRLYEAVENCKNQKIANDDGIHAMDIVAAYWIGDGETAGNVQEGHLLYNLAEKLAVIFGTKDESGLASANLNFLRLLNEARLELSFAESCSTDMATARKLFRAVNRIVGQMIVVLVQGLINAVATNDKDRVRIFAHGFVPLIAPCNAHAFLFLHESLITGAYEQREINDIVESIFKTLPCFELTCDHIGTHPESTVKCEDPPFQASLAGFKPSEDVADYAALDMDISLIDILMAQEAYEAAKDVYMFGKHQSAVGSTGSNPVPSLESLAKSTLMSSVPDHNIFVQYYSSNDFYAESMISSGLNSADLPAYRRRAMVVSGAQFLVMYMVVQEQFYQALKECKANRGGAADALWNRAAAYMIGSMEGSVNHVHEKSRGFFFWGISKQNCADWGTCRNIISGSTIANEKILSLLYTGRGAVGAQSCDALQKAIGELTPILRSIIVQSTLDHLVKMHQAKAVAEKNTHHAEAYIGAQALLPLINQKNREIASIISRNLDFENEPLEEDGFAVVAKGFTDSLASLGVDCEMVGGNDAVDNCSGEVEADDGTNVVMVVGIVCGILFGCLMALCLLWCRSKRKSSKELEIPGGPGGEEQPRFVRNSQGVMDDADTEYNPRNMASSDKVDDDDDNDEVDHSPNGRHTSSGHDDFDDKDASNASQEDFMDVPIPEPV